MQFKNVFSFSLCLMVAASALDAEVPFAPGQTWTYHARADQTASRVVVLGVEDHRQAGRVVHVALVGLGLQRKPEAPVEGWNIAHLPFAEKALRESVIELETPGRAPPDASEKTYQRWKVQAGRGKVSTWTTSVTSAMAEIERRVLNGAR